MFKFFVDEKKLYTSKKLILRKSCEDDSPKCPHPKIDLGHTKGNDDLLMMSFSKGFFFCLGAVKGSNMQKTQMVVWLKNLGP